MEDGGLPVLLHLIHILRGLFSLVWPVWFEVLGEMCGNRLNAHDVHIHRPDDHTHAHVFVFDWLLFLTALTWQHG